MADPNAGLDSEGNKVSPIVDKYADIADERIIGNYYQNALRLLKSGVNIVTEDGNTVVLDNSQKETLVELVENSIKGVESISDVIMNLLEYQVVTNDEAIG